MHHVIINGIDVFLFLFSLSPYILSPSKFDPMEPNFLYGTYFLGNASSILSFVVSLPMIWEGNFCCSCFLFFLARRVWALLSATQYESLRRRNVQYKESTNDIIWNRIIVGMITQITQKVATSCFHDRRTLATTATGISQITIYEHCCLPRSADIGRNRSWKRGISCQV